MRKDKNHFMKKKQNKPIKIYKLEIMKLKFVNQPQNPPKI